MKKMLNEIINQVYCADCFHFMEEIPDKSVDLVLTDPPYFLKWKKPIQLNGRKTMYYHKTETEKWDTTDSIVEFYDKLFIFFEKLVKNSGSILLFCRFENISDIVKIAEKYNFQDKSIIYWHKTNPIPQIRKKTYVSSVEVCIWLSRYFDKIQYTFNFTTQNDMHNFIEMPICMGNERYNHPTQKPLLLIKKLLMVHSNKNDLILDPFLGSGTTAVACKHLGRNFIGIDINPNYCELAQQRLCQEVLL